MYVGPRIACCVGWSHPWCPPQQIWGGYDNSWGNFEGNSEDNYCSQYNLLLMVCPTWDVASLEKIMKINMQNFVVLTVMATMGVTLHMIIVDVVVIVVKIWGWDVMWFNLESHMLMFQLMNWYKESYRVDKWCRSFFLLSENERSGKGGTTFFPSQESNAFSSYSGGLRISKWWHGETRGKRYVCFGQNFIEALSCVK